MRRDPDRTQAAEAPARVCRGERAGERAGERWPIRHVARGRAALVLAAVVAGRPIAPAAARSLEGASAPGGNASRRSSVGEVESAAQPATAGSEPPQSAAGEAAKSEPARADMSVRTGPIAPAPRDMPVEPGPTAPVARDMSSGASAGVDEAARLTADADAKLAAGDRDGAIDLYRRAFAALPTTLGHAQRRAAVALAIAAAEEAAFRDSGDPARLREASAALDAYLAGLDPTDDENRAGAERRRAELSDMLARAARPPGPQPLPGPAPGRRGLDPRAARAGYVLIGAAAAAGVVAVAGALAGRGADRYLARATARPCAGDDPDDPCGSDVVREALKIDARRDGVRANRLAIGGAAAAGALLVAGATALIAAALRGRSPARASSRGAALVIHF